jgi:protein gp37
MAPKVEWITDYWWDRTWNPFAGCNPVSPGCAGCYAARQAGTVRQESGAERELIGLYANTVEFLGGRYWFNGHLTARPDGDREWDMPVRWPGAEHPILGPGMPSLIFVGDMSDAFIEGRPIKDIHRTVGTLCRSRHIGQLLTKRTPRMAEYFLAMERSYPSAALARWRPRLWVGFSAERQKEFDERWPAMRELAALDYTIFCSIAPMLGPVRLPQDFLDLGQRAWTIVSGEQGPHRFVREMDLGWAVAVRNQCRESGVPLFVKQMSGKKPIRPDLLVRQFPRRNFLSPGLGV